MSSNAKTNGYKHREISQTQVDNLKDQSAGTVEFKVRRSSVIGDYLEK